MQVLWLYFEIAFSLYYHNQLYTTKHFKNTFGPKHGVIKDTLSTTSPPTPPHPKDYTTAIKFYIGKVADNKTF